MNRPLVALVARPAELTFENATIMRLRAWAATWWREAVPFAVITIIGLALRFVDLAVRPLHHDESEHAWFAWRLVSGHGYHYDPIFHGPVQFYLISLAYLILGVGDYATRVAPALMGTIIVFLPFFLRRQIGRVAAFIASAALCVSPSYLYFSRFAREDIYVACVTLALVVVLLRFLDSPRRWQPVAFFALLAVSFATKETTYITVFLFGLFFVGAAAVQGLRARREGRSFADGAIFRGLVSVGADAWGWAVATFLAIYTLLFSTFLTNPRGLREGLVGSIDYWLSQQPVHRGGQPWFYYLILMPAYEWPVIILGLVGIVAVVRRPSLIGAFLVWMFASSLFVYSWASERMPWLVIHPLLPLALLAGLGAQVLWLERRRLGAKLGLLLAGAAAVASVYFAVEVAYFRAADPRELLVQVQTSDDVPGIRTEVLRLAALVQRQTRQPLSLEVDNWGGTGWPWSWYLRNAPVAYYDMSNPPGSIPLAQAMLVADPNHATMDPRLKGYVAKRFRLRVWWVSEWTKASPGDWFHWVVSRKAWNPTATMDEWLYLRPDVAKLVSTPG